MSAQLQGSQGMCIEDDVLRAQQEMEEYIQNNEVLHADKVESGDTEKGITEVQTYKTDQIGIDTQPE